MLCIEPVRTSTRRTAKPVMTGDRQAAARPTGVTVGLDSTRPMRVYLEAVRAGGGRLNDVELERDLRRHGIFPDGELRYDLERLAAAGLVEHAGAARARPPDPARVTGPAQVTGPARATSGTRWRITAAGAELLDRMAAGGPEAPSPDHDVIGDWHRVEGYRYSASCLPATMPGWVVLAAQGATGVETLVTEWIYDTALRRAAGSPWAVTVRRIRRVLIRPRVVYRVEYDVPEVAAAEAARLDRQLRSGQLPPEVGTGTAVHG